MKRVYILILVMVVVSCKQSNNSEPTPTLTETQNEPTPVLNLEEAKRLAQLPIHCIQTEYPNKLGQVLGSAADLNSPQTLHPAFYGCFDWHSAVHGHWSLVFLLKTFPELPNSESIKQMLLQNISEENIRKEIDYFKGPHNKTYERTYGWAWLLKLSEELHTWDDPTARKLENNLKPLTDLIVQKYKDFLPKLNYPIRVGEHPNTAFGLTFAWDYANTVNDVSLKALIEERARVFYFNDTGCPITWEPGGFDFLSPCLEEASLMKRVLPKNEFMQWLTIFLPQLKNPNFTLETGKVSDRTDGKLVHLDGVNFSRAWCLNSIADGLPELNHLKKIANRHIHYSLPNIVDENYEGGHWLGSFALYALKSKMN